MSQATAKFHWQTGATTLLMATILLMAVSVIGVYSARTSIVEQRIAANTVWGQTTSDEAQAAADNLTAFTQTTFQTLAAGATQVNFSNTTSVDGAANVLNSPAISVPIGMQYNIAVINADTLDPYKTVKLDVGVNGPNGSTVKRFFETLTFGPFLREIPKADVTALGDATIPLANVKASSATVNAATLPQYVGMSPTGASILARTFAGAKVNSAPEEEEEDDLPAVLTPAAGTDYANLTPAQFEGNYFSDSGAHIKETVQNVFTCGTAANGTAPCTFSDFAKIASDITQKKTPLFIWVEGDLDLSGGTLGDFGAKVGMLDAGTDSTPVLLYVTGNLTLRNNATVNGLVYTRGNWNNGNNVGTVNGAVIVNGTGNGTGADINNQAGNFTSTGGLTLNYEFYILNKLRTLGSYTRVAGSWRDFQP